MKVERNSEEKKFQPVVITITIESQEELDAINYMGNMNISISNFVQERMPSIDPEIAYRQTNILIEFLAKLENKTRST